jgi:hypothetical protein
MLLIAPDDVRRVLRDALPRDDAPIATCSSSVPAAYADALAGDTT